MINTSKALIMSFAFLILTGPSYAGNREIPSDIKSPTTDGSEEKLEENKAKKNKGDLKGEKDNQPKEKQKKSSSQALKTS
jgi:hypothetical protein